MSDEDSIKQFRVFFQESGTVVDLWSYTLESAYKEAGEPRVCQIKVMTPDKGWRTICELNLTKGKETKDDLLLSI